MVLELKLRKVGNSVGLVLPKQALAHLKASEGDTVCLTDATEGSVRMTANPEVSRQMEVVKRCQAPLSQHAPRTGEMKMPVWILRETVLTLHEQSLAEFGGSAGIRDKGLIDSALSKPENRFAYGKPTIFDVATSYGFGLVKNHPFIDGNKRAGFIVAIVFLELNGYRFHATETDDALHTLAPAAGELSKTEFTAWLKANSRRV
jgi:death on curing protein